MKSSFKHLCLLFAFIMLFGTIVTGCDFDFSMLNDLNIGFDEEVVEEEDYEFSLSATLDKITINLDNIGFLGEEGTLVALQSFEYFREEELTGVATEIEATPYVIATYECGTKQEFVIDRYMIYYPNANKNTVEALEGQEVSPYTDGITLKYYVLDSKDNILAGPKYCSDFDAINTFEDPYPAKSIKGVMCEDTTAYMNYITDLGCSWVQLNFVTNSMFITNEDFDAIGNVSRSRKYHEYKNGAGQLSIKDEEVGAVYENVDFVDYNGQRYYFSLNAISGYDGIIKAYNANNIKVTLILLTQRWCTNRYPSPYITYAGLLEQAGMVPGKEGPYMQVNTSTREGANYWGAFMEFLAKHYTEKDENGNFKYGFVDNFVIGNEVDYAREWNAIVTVNQAPLSLENYLVEYERWIRIANQSVKKYYKDSTVLVSITHNWYSSSLNEYTPKNILDFLSAKTLEEGNYMWGIALHPYGADLPVADFWRNDTRNKGESKGMNGTLLTSKITYTNLEVLQLYLEQKGKLCNGEIRPVHITEGGVCGPTTPEGEKYQAAGIAYAYYKSSQLSCIKSLQYYRFRDHPAETAAGLYTGIMYADGVTLKKGYYVLKYIDKVDKYIDDIDSEELSAQLDLGPNGCLKQIQWTIGNQPHGYDIDCYSWQDLMTIFPSKFDWSTHWDESLIWPESARCDIV